MSGRYSRHPRHWMHRPDKLARKYHWPPLTDRCSGGALSSRPSTPRWRDCSGAAAPCWRSAARAGSARRACSTSWPRARAPPARCVLSGRAAELERELPFGVWEDALADHAAFLGVDRLERLVGDQLPSSPRCCPPSGASPAGLQDERYRTHRAVRALLEALAAAPAGRARRSTTSTGPTTPRWSSSPTCCAARRAAASRSRSRSGPRRCRPLLADRAGHRRARRRGDRARARRAVVRRRRDRCSGTDVPGPVRGAIYEAGGGNPFFLQQLARQHAAGRSVAAEPAGAGVPRAVARALEQEIAALSEAGRALAQGAAVAGDPVDLDLAAAAAGLGEDAALRARSTSCSPARCWPPPTCRAATASATRCAQRDLRVRRRRLADRRARPRGAPRWPSAAARSPRARTTSSAARGPATTEALEVLIEAGRHAAARAPATAADRFGAALRLLPETPETMPRRLELLVGARAGAGRDRPARGGAGGARRRASRWSGRSSRPCARGWSRAARCARTCSAATPPRTRGCSARSTSSARRSWAAARPRGRARRRRALRQRLRRRARVGAAGAGDRAGARRRRLRRRRGRAGVLRRARPGRDRRRAGAARGRRRAARRARRRRARRPPRHRLLPRLRRVLLRALRRRDPPLPPRHRRLARVRAGPVRDPDDDRARARAGGPRPAGARPPRPPTPPSRARGCGATARCSASR